jgi:hypothetical protein
MICSICEQDLIRKSSAIRHNHNFHLGEAVIVGPIEYIIRRLSNQFSARIDPLSFRHKMINQWVCPNYNDEDHNNDSTIFLINNKIGFKIESLAHDMGSRNDQAVPGQINITSTTSIITGNIIITKTKPISEEY